MAFAWSGMSRNAGLLYPKLLTNNFIENKKSRQFIGEAFLIAFLVGAWVWRQGCHAPGRQIARTFLLILEQHDPTACGEFAPYSRTRWIIFHYRYNFPL